MDKQTKAKLKIMQEYAKDREQAHAANMIAKDYAKEITKRYEEALESIMKEIEAFYSIYAEKEKITLAEARRRASQLDVERFEKKAKKYVKEKDFSKKANEELRLYNLTMKSNRLELLKNNIALELIHLGDDSEKYMQYVLNDEALAEIQRQAGILGKTAWHDPEMVQQIIDASFYDATFSDRIWADQFLLKTNIDQQLTKGIIQGINPKVMAGKIRDLFQSTQKQAERLLITESARVQTAIQKASFEKYGYEEYLFIAEPGACKVCGALAKKESYKTADMQPGINAAPMHPYCRCSVAAVFSDEEWKKDLEKRIGQASSPKEIKELLDSIDLKNATKDDIINLGSKVNKLHDIGSKIGNKEELKRIFSNYREIGGKIPASSWYKRSNKLVKSQLEEAFGFYPKDWVDYLASNNRTIFAGKTGRGFFQTELVQSNGRRLIKGSQLGEGVSIYGNGVRRTTPYHEIGHMIEFFNPDVLRIEKEWIESRTKGESPTRLKDIFPGSNYNINEITLKDNFISPYIGKIYDKASEVLSIGLESIFEPGEGQLHSIVNDKLIYKKITDDKDFLNLIIGLILKG